MPTTFSLTLHFPLPPSLPPTLVIQALHAYEPLIRPNPYLQNFRRLPVDMDEVVADPFFNDDDNNNNNNDDNFPSSSSTPSSPLSSPTTKNNQENSNHNNNIASYEIHDRIPVVGFLGIYKDTIFPATFQTISGGVKVKVDAAMGVKVRSVYEVCPKKRNHLGAAGAAGAAAGEGGGGEKEVVEGGDGLEPTSLRGQQQQHLELGGGSEEDYHHHHAPLWELVERSHVECGALLKPFVMKSFEAAHRDLCRKVLDNLVAGGGGGGGGGGAAASLPGARMDKDLPPLPPDEAR